MNLIAQVRRQNRITVSQLSAQLNWPHSSRLTNYELGYRTPDVKVARQIVAAFNQLGVACSLDQLFPEAK